MIDNSALRRAAIVGTVLQVALAILAHFSGWVALHALLFGCMMISATAGYLYAQDVALGYLAGALGGLIAGGICGLFGVALSVILGDSDAGQFISNVLIFLLTGAVGGLFGQMAAGMQAPQR